MSRMVSIIEMTVMTVLISNDPVEVRHVPETSQSCSIKFFAPMTNGCLAALLGNRGKWLHRSIQMRVETPCMHVVPQLKEKI